MEKINEKNVVHVYDAGFPLCYTRDRESPGPLWKVGPMVRQRSLANCPDCLGGRCTASATTGGPRGDL